MSSSAAASSAADGGASANNTSSSTAQSSASTLPRGWSTHVSRSTGRTYFYNHRENIAVWKDDSLAPGWGIRITEEGQFYLHLETFTTTQERPTPGNEPRLRNRRRRREPSASDTGTRSQSSRSSTEYRQSPGAGSVQGQSSQGPALQNGEVRIKYPRLEEDECSTGFPHSRLVPKKPKYVDYSQFGEAHQLVRFLVLGK